MALTKDKPKAEVAAATPRETVSGTGTVGGKTAKKRPKVPKLQMKGKVTPYEEEPVQKDKNKNDSIDKHNSDDKGEYVVTQ